MQKSLRPIYWVLIAAAVAVYGSTSLLDEGALLSTGEETQATTITEAPGTYAAAEIPGAVLNHELSKAPIPLTGPSVQGLETGAANLQAEAVLPAVEPIAPDLAPAPFVAPEAQAALNFADQAVKALEAEAAGLENAVTWRTASLAADRLRGKSKKRHYRAY